jgi:hypothetical protein
MRLGLFRTIDPLLGECACVDSRAGDAAPFLIKEFYEQLGFKPTFDDLPKRELCEAEHSDIFALSVDPRLYREASRADCR